MHTCASFVAENTDCKINMESMSKIEAENKKKCSQLFSGTCWNMPVWIHACSFSITLDKCLHLYCLFYTKCGANDLPRPSILQPRCTDRPLCDGAVTLTDAALTIVRSRPVLPTAAHWLMLLWYSLWCPELFPYTTLQLMLAMVTLLGSCGPYRFLRASQRDRGGCE